MSSEGVGHDDSVGNAPRPSVSRVAARGIAWAGSSLVFGRILAVLSQVLLGLVLPVEVFAVFALVLLVSSIFGGFQESGVAKVLVARHRDFESLVRDYVSFAFWFAFAGALTMSAALIALSRTLYREHSGFLGAGLVTAAAMPVFALVTVHAASLGLSHRFKALSLIEMVKLGVYYALLVLVAFAGFGPYAIAFATLVGVCVQFLLLRSRTKGSVPPPGRIRVRSAMSVLFQVRWALATSFLTALAVRGDYLVLGNFLAPEELAYYHFGFMILSQVMGVVSVVIAQVLTPVYAKMNSDLFTLRANLVRGAALMTHLAGFICLGIFAFGPWSVHLVWGGKWDPAIAVILTVALSLPIRMAGMVAGTVLEAVLAWRIRFALLGFDMVMLLLFAWVGVRLAGLEGAAVLVAVQRAVAGLAAFVAAAFRVRMTVRGVLSSVSRVFLPYGAPAVYLCWVGSVSAGSTLDLMFSVRILLVAVILMVGSMWVFDRSALRDLPGLLKQVVSR